MASAVSRFAALAAFATLGMVAFPSSARATVPTACASLTRENVALCAVHASAAIQADREAASAAGGRVVAAAPWFPSNPTLSVSVARRAGTEGRGGALNYNASLSQEIEVAGQRGARRRAAEADVQARVQGTAATSRRVAADGYAAWFDVLASRDALDVARRLETTALQIARVTQGRADAGVASALDAEVADAMSLRVTQARLAAERELRIQSARLVSLVGRDPTREDVPVVGVLEPLRGVDAVAGALNGELARRRPEVRALESEQSAYEARAQAFQRARVPTLTFQLFAQNDGYNERVLGAGLSLPIPLPQPVGHFFNGEIREAEALARQTRARSEVLVRGFRTDVAIAVASYESHRAEAALFTAERVARSERLLSEIAKEIELGRLSVRDALLAQEHLIDILHGFVETRRALCLASVELALAVGVPLETGGR